MIFNMTHKKIHSELIVLSFLILLIVSSAVVFSRAIAQENELLDASEDLLDKVDINQDYSSINVDGNDGKATIEAENIYYENSSENLVASGDVFLSYDEKEVRASRVRYNRKTREIVAEEGIEFKSKQGNKFKASKLITDDEFKTGEMSDVQGELGDGSIFKSKQLILVDQETYLLKNSSYSPCKPCEGGLVFWDIKADQIEYNEEDGRVYYRDATLEIMGIPIMYTPYISHPTPFAESKSGFLTPSLGISSEYGSFLTVPYYYQPSRSVDFTFTPTITADDGPILHLEHRQMFHSGEYKFVVSGAYPEERDAFGNIVGDDRDFRGHVEALGRFDMGNHWDLIFNANRTTDDTYLQRYDFGYEDVLTSELEINRINNRDLISFKALSFQGLRQNDNPDVTPYILPLTEGNKSFEIGGKYNQTVNLGINSLVLRRSLGAKSSRFIGVADWQAGYTTDGGHVFEAELSNRIDYYNIDDSPFNGGTFDGTVKRVIPQAELSWKYPLYSLINNSVFVIEPTAMLVVSPHGNNDLRIPNEDSQNIEIYDYNLFQPDHISGYDYVESGTRTNYGFRGNLSFSEDGDLNFLVGQNYRVKKDSTLGASSGMDEHFSDYVGRVTYTNNDYFYANYRFRLDKDNAKFKRNEVGYTIDTEYLDVSTTYTFIDGLSGAVDRQEIYSNVKTKIDDNWSLLADVRRNLDNDNNQGWVHASGGFEYTNDCFTSQVHLRREFIRDRDVEPSTEILFQIVLKNIGS